MTATKMVQQALNLLGYAENSGNSQLTQRIMNRAVSLLNLVYSDLSRVCEVDNKPITTLVDEIKLPQKAMDVFACGLAGYIAQSEGDDNQQYFWTTEYQTRRTKLSRVTSYEDILPIPD